MTQPEIKRFLEEHAAKKQRTILIVDFANVEKWKQSLGWSVNIAGIGKLAKHFTLGSKFLRRFYYGEDFGPKESSIELLPWSKGMLEKAKMSGFELITKRVKYIWSDNNVHGFQAKCDLDVEMAVDLIRERDNYDTAVIFSGDGDMAYVIRYLHATYGKKVIVFAARDHVGREIVDAMKDGVVEQILYAEDFEYRLRLGR